MDSELNGNDTQNETCDDRKLDENNTALGVGNKCGCKDGEGGKCNNADCNCSEGRSSDIRPKKLGAKGGTGGNVLRSKGPNRVRDEEAKCVVMRELRTIAKGIEDGQIQVVEAKSNKVMNAQTKQYGYMLQLLYVPIAPVENKNVKQ